MFLTYNTSDKELNYPVLERQFCKVFSGFWKQPICVFEILSIHSILWPRCLKKKTPTDEYKLFQYVADACNKRH